MCHMLEFEQSYKYKKKVLLKGFSPITSEESEPILQPKTSSPSPCSDFPTFNSETFPQSLIDSGYQNDIKEQLESVLKQLVETIVDSGQKINNLEDDIKSKNEIINKLKSALENSDFDKCKYKKECEQKMSN